MKHIELRKVLVYGIVLGWAGHAGAMNHIGDANLDGNVTLEDAALVLNRVLGNVGAAEVSILALADADLDLDLRDVQLIGRQQIVGPQNLPGPGSLLNLTGPGTATSEDGAPLLRRVWTYSSSVPTVASRVDNLELFWTLSTAGTNSRHARDDGRVRLDQTVVADFVPRNAGTVTANVVSTPILRIYDSEADSLRTTTSLPASVLVSPPVCGNGVLQQGEGCDDGNTDELDGCDSSCNLTDAAGLCAGVPVSPGTSIVTYQMFGGLSRPVQLTAPPLDTRRMMVVEQAGRIRLVKNDALQSTPFLDIQSQVSCCSERGLLSMAFDPDYGTNGRFFVDYTDLNGNTVVSRFEVSADPDQADAASELVLFTITQPYSNHNGGQLQFGPDGMLYIGTGDGGSGGDPLENAQNPDSPLGKLLRIDVDVDTPPYYALPSDNPDAGMGWPRGAIWQSGLRNPWRYSFDPQTGDLYIGDVGQSAWEEIDWTPFADAAGIDWGWDVFEGTHCYDPAPHYATCDDALANVWMPVHEYDHITGCAVTGGHVYRGCAMPDLQGTYFYGDWCTDMIASLKMAGGVATELTDWTPILAGGVPIDAPTAFGRDARGELYIVDGYGELFRIVAAP